jgi:hypothetical protein
MARIGYRSALIVACAAVLVAAAPPAVAAVADTTPPELKSITLSREDITVSGLNVELLTVSVRLTDDEGVVDSPSNIDNTYPTLYFSSPRVAVYLQLGSGTARDGVWTGVAPVTSDWDAYSQPTRVDAVDEAGNFLFVDPRTVIDTPAVRVHSSNEPVLTATVTPDPVLPRNAVTRTIRAVNKTTGQPWPRLPIAVTTAEGCDPALGSAPNAKTDANGVWRDTLPAGTIWGANCVWVPGAGNVPGQFETRISALVARPRYQYVVYAKPTTTSAPAGTNIEVTGSVTPAVEGKTVNLQRLYGTTWRTVSTALTRASSRYTVVTTPPGVGAWIYRVQVDDGEFRVGNVSPRFVLRGTAAAG